jgi:hypothetical protein
MRGRQYFEKHKRDIYEQYSGKWIAIQSDKIIASGDTEEQLHKSLPNAKECYITPVVIPPIDPIAPLT